MKNISFLKYALITGMLLLIFSGCQNEEPESSHHLHAEKASSISLAQFKQETGLDNFKTVFRAKSIASGPALRGASEPSDFVLDTTAIEKHTGHNGILSYSFFVYPLDHEIAGENEIFNLAYYKENGKWETIILSLEKTSEGSQTQYENIKEIYSSASRNAVCWGTQYTFHCTKTGPCAGGNCDLCNLCVSSSAITVPCGSEPENPGTGTGTDPDIGVNPGGGGGGIPVQAFMAALQLDLAQSQWLDANPFFKARLIEGYIGVPNIAAIAAIRQEFKAKLDYMMNYTEMCQSIVAFVEQQQYVEEAQKFGWEIVDLAMSETNQADVNNLVQLSLLVEASGDTFFSEEFAESLLPYTDLGATGIPPTHYSPISTLTLKTYLNYRKLRSVNPEWSRAKCIWYATKEIIHVSLDVFGLIPVAGEVADLANGVLYTIEGDGINAALSYASAIPVVGYGSVATKYGLKIINSTQTATVISTKVKLVWKVTSNGVTFGSRSQLRKVLGLGVGDPRQAHHLIPWAKSTHPAVQKAAKSGNAFHMNEALNGIPLSTAVHSGSHANYDNLIQRYLDAIPPSATPNQAYNAINALLDRIRAAIQNNPGVPINQLNF